VFILNRLTPGQTLPSPDAVEEPRGQAIWHRIWHGRRNTHCDRRDWAGRAYKALCAVSVPVVILRRDRRDWLGRRHPPTDQKVGGSNPSERAKVLVRALLNHV